LVQAGFVDVADGPRSGSGGAEVDLVARDAAGRTWSFIVPGGFTTTRPGLQRSDALWKAIGSAAVLHAAGDGDGASRHCAVLTPARPALGSAGAAALAAVTGPGKPIDDVIVLTDADDLDRLHRRAHAPSDR